MIKLLKITIFFFIGTFLGYVGFVAVSQSPTNSPPPEQKSIPEARFTGEQKIPITDRILDDDFYTRIGSGKCDYKHELALLLEEYKTTRSLNTSRAKYLLSKWGYESPHAALAALIDAPLEEKYYLMNCAFDGWTDKNPEEVAQYYKENNVELYATAALGIAIDKWGKIDPVNALKFLTTLSAREQGFGLDILLKSADFKQDEYLKMAEMIPSRQLNNEEILQTFMYKWFSNYPLTATQWMNSLSPEQQKMLERFKGWDESLPSLNEIVEQSMHNQADALKSLALLPRNLQVEAWTKVLDEICRDQGTKEMVKWSTLLPIDISVDIFNNPYFAGPMNTIPDDDINQFAAFLATLPAEHYGNGSFGNSAVNLFEERFAYRFPEETVNFMQKMNNTPFISFPIFKYESPDAAKRWLNDPNTSAFYREAFQHSIDKNFDSPPGTIKKNVFR